MKKKLIVALAIVALLLPTFLAIGSYLKKDKSPAETGDITEITILDLDGNSFNLTVADDTDKVIESLLALENGATQIDTLPDPLITADYFMITYKNSTANDANHKYYISLDEDQVYFVNADGVAFQADKASAEKFISSKYALCLYDAAKAPTLTVFDKNIAADEIIWMYKAANGSFITRDDMAAADTRVNVALGGALDFTFDVKPDMLDVKIMDGNTTLFDDKYENLGDLSLNKSATLSVTLKAEWLEDAKRDYKGSATYSFDVTVSESPAFYLVANEIAPGDFVVLTGKNVADISKITFTSTPSIDFTPVFFRDGDYVRALVPIKLELDNKSYIFTVKYGNTFTQELNLSIREQTFAERTWTNSKENLALTRSESVLTAYKAVTAPIAKTQVSEKLWKDGEWGSVGKNSTAIAGFGQRVTLKATGEKLRNDGCFYAMAKGGVVTAINSGKVIYAGVTDHSGRMVVVDHGWGLKSWYSNLSEIKVAEGDMVEMGAELGVVGSSGFIKDEKTNVVNLKLTVFDVPVFPYDSASHGGLNIKMYK